MAFANTRWSLVLAAGEESKTALSDLITIYWYPLYAFARRRGVESHAAEDLVQGFFAVLIEKGYLRAADRERGRFRTFLLTAFRHYMSKEREKAAAQKRGGDRVHLSLDFESGEERYRLEPESDLTPERLFEREWALTLLEHVLSELEETAAHKGKGKLFAQLRPFLTSGSPAPSAADAADRLNMTSGAFQVALHRLKRQYRDALRAGIAETVQTPAVINDEIRRLMEAVAY